MKPHPQSHALAAMLRSLGILWLDESVEPRVLASLFGAEPPGPHGLAHLLTITAHDVDPDEPVEPGRAIVGSAAFPFADQRWCSAYDAALEEEPLRIFRIDPSGGPRGDVAQIYTLRGPDRIDRLRTCVAPDADPDALETVWGDAANAANEIPAFDPDNTFGDAPLGDDADGEPAGGLHDLDETIAAIELAAIVDQELRDAGSARAVFRLGEWGDPAERMAIVLVGPRSWGPRLREAGYTLCEASTCDHAEQGDVHEIEWLEGRLGPLDPW